MLRGERANSAEAPNGGWRRIGSGEVSYWRQYTCKILLEKGTNWIFSWIEALQHCNDILIAMCIQGRIKHWLREVKWLSDSCMKQGTRCLRWSPVTSCPWASKPRDCTYGGKMSIRVIVINTNSSQKGSVFSRLKRRCLVKLSCEIIKI